MIGVIFVFCAILLAAIVASFAIGARFVPFDQVVAALFGSGEQGVVGIVGTLRVDRTVAALICGPALGVSGVLLQALTRNPVADPGMLGVNAGASFGVVVALTVFGAAELGTSATIWFALLGAVLASGVILAFAQSRFAAGSPLRLTLAGVAFAAVLVGVTQALVLTNETALDSYRFWRIGSLAARPLSDALPLVGFVVAGLLLAVLLAAPLNVTMLGTESATSLGVRPGQLRVVVLISVALLCGAATALAGPITFVGLVVPHMLRRIVGPDLRVVLPLAMIASPSVLLIADIIGRVIGQGAEVQVGIVTAFLGSLILLVFVLRSRKALAA